MLPMPSKSVRQGSRILLEEILAERIMILDGAMGTMIQTHALGEEDYRGARFREHPRPLRLCNDLLVLTQPELIAGIHRAYFEAGADIRSEERRVGKARRH